MQSSRLVTLFSEPPTSNREGSAFFGSLVLHAAVVVLVYQGLRHVPIAYHMTFAQTHPVRYVNLESPKPQMRWAPESQVAQAGQQAAARAVAPGGNPAQMTIPQLVAQKAIAPQTVVQPNLPPNLLAPHEIPIPQVLLWSHETTPVKRIAPPPPHPEASADVQPSLSPPNRELIPADIQMSSSAFLTQLPTIPPSTTSPIAVRGAQPIPMVPETTSTLVEQPTPASVLALSEMRMVQGVVAVPVVNETALPSTSGSLAAGSPKGQSQAGHGSANSRQTGVGAGQDAGSRGNSAAVASVGGGHQGTNGDSTSAADVNFGSGNAPTEHHITVPKDGKFGVVVVGSSLTDQYPETSGMWSGRLAYTVYLHLGLAKSWILQYSLPRDASVSTSAGTPVRPDAPWPYDIERPDLEADANPDAVLVHGFVNKTGHFEHLAVIYPQEFTETDFVLGSLQRWQFRPAMQNGQATAVEILLIIPSQEE